MVKAEIVFIKEVASVTSIIFAQKLVENFCGRKVYVPRKMPHEKHYLRQALSPEEMKILIENFGGETLVIPMSLTNEAPLRKKRILELKAKRYNVQDIASQANCCWRWVQKVLKKDRERREIEKNQGNLFD